MSRAPTIFERLHNFADTNGFKSNESLQETHNCHLSGFNDNPEFNDKSLLRTIYQNKTATLHIDITYLHIPCHHID